MVLLHEPYPSPSVLRWWAPLPLDRLAETLLVQVVEEAWDGPAYVQAVFAASAVWPAVEGLVLMLRVLADYRAPEAVRQHVDAGFDSVVRGRGSLLLPALWVAESRVHGEAPLAGRYVAGLSGEDPLALVNVLRHSERRSLLEFALVLLDRVEEAAWGAGDGRSAPPPMLLVLRAMILVPLERYTEAMRLTGGLLYDLRADVARRTALDVPADQPVIHFATHGGTLRMTFLGHGRQR